MRKFLSGLLGMLLCVQTVYGIPVRAADVFEPGERPKAMQDAGTGRRAGSAGKA